MYLCKRCHHPVVKECDPTIDYPFFCPNCDENMYSFEVEDVSPSTAYILWAEFGDVPMNPETECIEEEWYGFEAGTHREEIWHWFEETFNVSVAKDLMGL